MNSRRKEKKIVDHHHHFWTRRQATQEWKWSEEQSNRVKKIRAIQLFFGFCHCHYHDRQPMWVFFLVENGRYDNFCLRNWWTARLGYVYLENNLFFSIWFVFMSFTTWFAHPGRDDDLTTAAISQRNTTATTPNANVTINIKEIYHCRTSYISTISHVENRNCKSFVNTGLVCVRANVKIQFTNWAFLYLLIDWFEFYDERNEYNRNQQMYW